ncbi:hypothetical protein VPH35_058870 [Triticum aestivum]
MVIKLGYQEQYGNRQIPSLIDLLERGTGGRGAPSGGGDVLRRELSLGLVSSAAASLAVEEGLAVLVELELGDDHLAGVDADVHRGSIDLLPGDPLHVDDPAAAVDLHHLSLAALVGAAHDLHLVVLADRDGADVIFVAELGGEGRGHEHAADGGRRREVRLAALPAGARDAGVALHGGSGGWALSLTWGVGGG